MANNQIDLPLSFQDANTYKNQYTTLQTNFNVSPYYDDFNIDKQFYRLLFKPGYAVQARELTQIQSMLQNQINKFGQHVFKEGSIVLGGQFAIERYDYVKVADLDTNNSVVDITKFEKQTFTNPTTGLTAYVHKVLDGNQSATDQKMLFVRYTNSGSVGAYSGVTKTFSAGDTIVSAQGTLKVLDSSYTPIGYGSIFFVSEGIFFAKNHFLSFPTQSVVIDRYTTTATCRVGFVITEDIIKYSDDISLLDPALESSNYSAPGADRLKLTPILTRKDITDNPGPPDYVDLIEIRNGVITETFETTQYNRLGDEFASRTFDESGDYYINGLTVQIKEHLDNGQNGGKYTANTDPVGNANKLAIGVEPGTAYVKGYKVWTGGLTRWVDTDKATAFANVDNQISGSNLGNYFLCKEYCGSWAHDVGTLVNLYDTAQSAVTNKTLSNTTPTGNIIGTAKVKAVEKYSGVLGSASAQVEIYLFDVQINSGYTLSQVRSLSNTATARMVADIVLETDGTAKLKDTATSILLYETGSDFTKTVRGTDGSNQTTFVHKRSKNVNISSTGELILSVDDVTNEQFTYGSGAYIGSDQKKEIILNLATSFNLGMVGYAATTSGSKTVTGVNTKFTRLNPGDKVTFTDIGGTYIIDFITNDTTMNLTTTASGTDSNTTFSKVYVNGDVIDLTTKGSDAGAIRTVQQTSSTSMTIELNETFGASKAATISYRIYRRVSKEVKKVKRANRFVIINCATAGTTGPFNLGLSDVFKITSIRKNTGAFSSETDGSDVTGSFVLDTGQRDELYDHAKLLPKISLASTDYLLVKLDYFYPDFSDSASAGYYSVDSYPINDSIVSATTIQTSQIPLYKSPVTGTTYDLRNCLDFRPVKQNTANDSQTIGGASTNPATTNTFYYSGLGYRMPAPSSQIQYDYSYYLARRDIVVIDKNGIISVIEGVPSIVPITPETPPNVMDIASIFVAPYPSLSPYYANILNRMDLACISKKTTNIRFTMRDIGVLKSRIENLELYTSLNALEKQAADFTILNASGLDRFKNGIFADTFRDHTLGATNRPDYKIAVDSRENSIRPVYEMEDLYYRVIPNSNTNIVLRDSLLMLDYTENTFIEQAAVTTYRNIETSVYRYVGNLVLNPDTDVWIDTKTAPDNQVTLGSDVQGAQVTSSEWNAWQTKVVGYNIYQDGKLLGSYNNLTDATSAASAISGYYNRKQGGNYGTIKPVFLETVYDNTRTGKQVSSDIYTTNQNLGNRVTDVELIPYIRPQVIRFFASGMKAISRFYTYFDGVDMSKYVTPTYTQWAKITPVSSNTTNVITGQANTIVTGWVQGPPEGSALVSDNYGYVWGELRLPADGPKFRVGTKELLLTDSPVNDDSATSTAVNYFVSQGLVQTKQDTILTTRQVITTSLDATQEQQTSTSVVINPRYGDSCTAYSFKVTAPDGEEGVFLSSVDVWLAAVDVDNQRGVWFEIKEMDNGGGVTNTQVPLSEVWYDADYMNQFVITPEDINALSTQQAKQDLFDNNYFRVKFRAPVFLYKNRQYAFTIHTQGVNPYTYFWMSKYGETDLITGNQVTARPMTGTLFVTNNNLNWTQVIGWDLKVRFNRAKFMVNDPLTSNALGKVTLTNELYERPLLKAVSNTPYQGEKLVSNRITLSNPTLSTKIQVGDRIVTFVNVVTTNTVTNTVYSNTTSANISVVAIHDTTANTFNVANCVYFVDWDSVNGYYNPYTALGLGPAGTYMARDGYYSNLANFASQTVNGLRINGTTSVSFQFDDAIKNGKLLYVYSANGAPRLDANGQPVTVNVASYYSKSISMDQIQNLYSNRVKPSLGDFYATLTTQSNPQVYTATGNTLSYNTVNTVTTTVTNVNTVVSQTVTIGYYSMSARSTSGNIEKNDVFMGQDSGSIIVLNDLARFSYSTLDFEPAALIFNDSYVTYEIRSTQNSATPVTGSTYLPITPGQNFYFNTEQVLLSKSEQDLLIGGKESQDIRVTMTTTSDYTSPIIDLARTHGIFVHNLINSDVTDETAPTGGSLINKYISKTITLAEGQDAEDVKVLLTSYRPSGTDVRVYMKIRHNEDSDFFDVKDWVELVSTSPNLYSSSSSLTDWLEFEYDFPTDYKEIITCTAANTLPTTITLGSGNTIVGRTSGITANITGSRTGYIFITDNKGFTSNETANVVNSNGYVIGNTVISAIGRTASINANTGIVEYWTQTGVNFKGYKQFSIKIGLASNNSAIVPRVADVRAIAIQV